MNRKIREIMSARENGESGFTLIELLVVIIIIGILASIAIPIFMNQQKTARDSATTSDVKNVATNVQSALTRYPDATYFAVADDNGTATQTAPAASGAAFATDGTPATTTPPAPAVASSGKVRIWVGDSSTKNEMYDVSVSKGTQVSIEQGTTAGTFVVKAYNASGKSYVQASPLAYDSAAGGIKN